MTASITQQEAFNAANEFDTELRMLINRYQSRTYAVFVVGILEEVKYEQLMFSVQDRLLAEGNPNVITTDNNP